VIELPDAEGNLIAFEPKKTPSPFAPGGPALRSRTLFSAAHVVADPTAPNAQYGPATLDWDATMAFRRHLWSHGLAVTEAQDTSQRGMGLDWPLAAELITRSGAEAKAVGGRLSAAIWTDQLDPTAAHSVADVLAAYEQQMEVAEQAGAEIVILASRQLAAAATGPDDYAAVYRQLIKQASKPVVLHWVRELMDPGLAGYWGSADPDQALENFLAVVAENADKIDGVKVLPQALDRELEMRRRLPDGVKCYTGDDMSYPTLIAGDGTHHSHALLGILDPLAPLAAAAVRKLDEGDTAGFMELLGPTVQMSFHLFEGTGMDIRFYKTGFTFLAWLSGHQDHFRMIWSEQNDRSPAHLAKAYQLADAFDLFPDPDLAEARMRQYLVDAGVTA
jgi:Protein of unknown function (DUF993)